MKAWFVPGRTAERRIGVGLAEMEAEADTFADEKERDAIVFDPIGSRYLEAAPSADEEGRSCFSLLQQSLSGGGARRARATPSSCPSNYFDAHDLRRSELDAPALVEVLVPASEQAISAFPRRSRPTAISCWQAPVRMGWRHHRQA
ncbi:hypothetical protein [Rhizobium leguminosarum]|uniref:hypothetical protein n=1 Tax=Rhizobium leguminosarum TaxID=384 RepID=UPI0028C420D3|nr:hypothetical protein [Rhizobium leguminosarum]